MQYVQQLSRVAADKQRVTDNAQNSGTLFLLQGISSEVATFERLNLHHQRLLGQTTEAARPSPTVQSRLSGATLRLWRAYLPEPL